MSLKEEILYNLECARREDRELSGEELAGKLGVSRMAVCKAVNTLREEGVEISSRRGGGYRMARQDLLSEGRVRAHLPGECMGLKLTVYGEPDSTNKRAKLFAEEGNFTGEALFVADSQTAGRGRLGRSFYSPASTGLYLSYLFSSEAPLQTLTAVTPYAAVSVAKILERYTEKKILIKWVNDLYSEGRKVCGILTEALTSLESGGDNRVVVGIGINLNTEIFPEELSEKAGSLGCRPDRSILAAEIASQLHAFAREPWKRTFMQEYTRRSMVLGRRVVLDCWGARTEGVAVGFDENGGLFLDTGKGEPELFTGGEISLRLSGKE